MGPARRSRHAFRFLLVSLNGLAVFAAITACVSSGDSRSELLDDPRGEASYYADDFAGETTANGETFDPDDMTAAHPSLPFGTVVRVTRVGTEERRSVEVRINDRGPYADDRIIDLSKAAAEELAMIQEGVVTVKIEILEVPSEAEEEAETSEREEGGW